MTECDICEHCGTPVHFPLSDGYPVWVHDHGLIACSIDTVATPRTQRVPIPEAPKLADWNNPDTQKIYAILCDDLEHRPSEEHWEGYCSRWIAHDLIEPLRAELARAEATIAEIKNILSDALDGFKCTQNPKDYGADHWSNRAARATGKESR